MALSGLALTLNVAFAAGSIPSTMRSVRTLGGCSAPFSCVHVNNVKTPKPSKSQPVLVRINATSVNPSDVDDVEMGGCMFGCGADVAGVVVSCDGCSHFKVGDEVWGFSQPAYSEYVIGSETTFALKPKNLEMAAAGTIPEVGLTSYMSLKRTGSEPGTDLPSGSPWGNKYANLTVVITEGAGGTGFIGIEMAKAWGAKHIATATTSAEGFKFVKELGADIVTDYKVQNIFDALPDNSVDIVYDNYGKEGTADKAMRVIRPGGVYLLMPHGECFSKKTQGPPCLSANPKKGVRQLNYVTGPDFQAHAQQGLEEMKTLFESGKLSPRIDKTFSLEDAAKAFNYSAGPGEGGVGHHYGKIALSASAQPQLSNVIV